MKKEFTGKELEIWKDLLGKKFHKDTKFSFEVPVAFEDTEGTLHIDFGLRTECRVEKINKGIDKIERLIGVLSRLTKDLDIFIQFIKEIILFDGNVNKKHFSEINQSIALQSSLLIFSPKTAEKFLKNSWGSSLGNIIHAKEDGLFELIKSEGPMILCNPDAQNKINEFLSDKATAGTKMNKLKDSLLEYGLGPSFIKKRYRLEGKEDPQFKLGRPEIDIVKKIGEEQISVNHKFLTGLFKHIKRSAAKYKKIDSVDKIFSNEEKCFFDLLKKALREAQFDGFSDYIEVLLELDPHPLSFISKFINNNKDLKAEFLKYGWEPNKFAKKLLARLLNISESKLTKILYQRKA